jgi:RNA polymerase sigma factor (TIGR02999 family)
LNRGSEVDNSGGSEREEAALLPEILPRLYPELRRIAARLLRSERRGHTLQPTALVNEVYLRLATEDSPSFRDEAHLRATAARAMRFVLVDHAKRRRAEKRGRGLRRVTLSLVEGKPARRDPDLLSLHEALEKLATVEPRKAQVVDLRAFGGYSLEETAEALGISTGTVKRCWISARAWLFRELHGDEG